MERPWHKSWPAGIPGELAYPQPPLWRLLEKQAAERGTQTALVDGNRNIPYSSLWEDARAFTDEFEKESIARGSRCVLALPNSEAFMSAYFGILRAGCVAVPVNPLAKRDELETVIANTQPAVLVLSRQCAEATGFPVNIPDVRRGVKDWPFVLIRTKREVSPLPPQVGEGESEGGLSPTRGVNSSGRHNNTAPTAWRNGVSPYIAAVIQQTGGTTGFSRGAVMSHENLIANAVQNATWFGWTPDDVIMGLLPFCHTWGLCTCVNSPIYAGAKVVSLERYDAEKAFELVQQHGITVWYGAASLFIMLLAHPALKHAKLSSLRYVKAGAMPIPHDLPKRWEDATGVKFVTGYGLTEASPETHDSPLERVKAGSVGIPLPDTDAKIVDADDPSRELPPGVSGELLIKGPQVMREYWNQPAETEAAFHDGWLRTGDIAYMDDDGYFYIVDRRKDLIKYKGHSIYPHELENILYKHAAVRECAVIGKPDAEAGELPKAFVALKDGCNASAEEILGYCAALVAPQKKVREVEFVKEIPKNRVGKVLRRKLRAREKPLARFLLQAERICAFTGAGVSAESGIPTYRGEGGLWTKYDPDKFASIDYFEKDPTYFWTFFKEIRIPLLKGAKPGPTHRALATLEAAGKLFAVITQNIDGLHQAAGSKTVFELHGNTRTMLCSKCGARYELAEVDEILETQMPPRCGKCSGVLRPDVVFFGESLPEDVLAGAFQAAARCDLMLALGSSLVVYPAAGIPLVAKERGARLVIINKGGTPFDPFADLALDAGAGEELMQAVEALCP